MRHTKILRILFIALLIGGIVACVKVGELKEETQAVQLGEAESVDVELKIGTGELRLGGGASQLMEGYFLYNVDRWRPEVDYHVFGKRGTLKVRQTKTSGMPVGNAKNKWEISLNNDVPIDLEIDFGVGEGKLDFRGIKLQSLNIDMGVGELTVDLTGERSVSLDIIIDGGVGSGTIYLPEEIGVRVKVDGGLGSIDAIGMNKDGHVFTNDSYGKTDVSMDIEIDAGIGSLDLIVK
jgi:hypothetical protein